ncbi:MAG: ABC transporter permease [Bifidobacterium psychraerophilum]|uniref:ABC transporter permease n=1 Tax=Bifidobacterium psychraerophilum TaxID=218140 RepID=UPI0039EB4A21
MEHFIRLHPFGWTFAKRLISTVLMAFVVMFVVFFTIRMIPGDPAVNLLGADSTPQQREEMRAILGLDKPLLVQFGVWLSQLAHGDLGYSYAYGRDAIRVVLPALQNTLMLGAFASLLAIVIAVILGNFGASERKGVRQTAGWIEAFFLSAPQYAIALVLLIVLAVQFQIFPSGGVHQSDVTGFPDLVAHLFLPALALSLAPGAQMARSLKTSLTEICGSDLISSLEARGLGRGALLVHSYRNAIPPMITVLAIQVGSMLGGALFVENIFSIPGLGQLIVQSVGLRDFQTVQSGALVVALIYVVVLMLGDMATMWIDPRLRRSSHV